jgi:hypothetical protein
MTLAGFPHSGITGSKPACGSPMLFAAYHALHRLSVPRHPPCALIRLIGFACLSSSNTLQRTSTPALISPLRERVKQRSGALQQTHASRCSSGPNTHY